MRRSSESIGAIAGALAKAPVELIGIIRSPFSREAERAFRYAPLSSSLEISSQIERSNRREQDFGVTRVQLRSARRAACSRARRFQPFLRGLDAGSSSPSVEFAC